MHKLSIFDNHATTVGKLLSASIAILLMCCIVFCTVMFRTDMILKVNIQSFHNLNVNPISLETVVSQINLNNNSSLNNSLTGVNGVNAGDGSSIYSRVPAQTHYTKQQIDQFIAQGKFTESTLYQISYIIKHEMDGSGILKYESCYVMANACYNHFKKENCLDDARTWCENHKSYAGGGYTPGDSSLTANSNRLDAIVTMLLLGDSGDIIHGASMWFGKCSGKNFYSLNTCKFWCAVGLGNDKKTNPWNYKDLNIIYLKWGTVHNSSDSDLDKLQTMFYEGSSRTWKVKDGQFHDEF